MVIIIQPNAANLNHYNEHACPRKMNPLSALSHKRHQCQVPRALDRGAQLALLAWVEPGLATRFNLTVHVDKSLQRLDVFVVKIRGDVFFKSSSHFFLLSVES